MWWMWLAMQANAETHVWARAIQRLDVDQTAGDVHLEQGGDRIEVRLVPMDDRGCDVSVGEGQGRATVGIRETGAAPCHVDVAVRLPRRGPGHRGPRRRHGGADLPGKCETHASTGTELIARAGRGRVRIR